MIRSDRMGYIRANGVQFLLKQFQMVMKTLSCWAKHFHLPTYLTWSIFIALVRIKPALTHNN